MSSCTNRSWLIEGTRRSVLAQLLLLFPWMRAPAREQGFTGEAIMDLINIQQGYSACKLPSKARES